MVVDALIVGGGPAGLVAAVYLARFRRSALVVDAGSGRAALIPHSHNCPGFPEGIAGRDLLSRLREQAREYGASIVDGVVDAVDRLSNGRFVTQMAGATVEARALILATGVVDVEPALPRLNDAIGRGLVRHCPICDGYEVIGKRASVIGNGAKGAREARFIRHFASSVTLFTLGHGALTRDERSELDAADVAVNESGVIEVHLEGPAIVGMQTADGRNHRFDTLYSALGCIPRSSLARATGVACGVDGMILTDRHQRTSVENVYACGDIIHDSLNQIAVAFGQSAIAATALHNAL